MGHRGNFSDFLEIIHSVLEFLYYGHQIVFLFLGRKGILDPVLSSAVLRGAHIFAQVSIYTSH